MKQYDQKKSQCPTPVFLRMLGGAAVLCFLIVSLHMTASAASINGGSDTIFRMQQTNDKNLYPLYEYLHFSGSDTAGDKGTLSFQGGGWGRVDLRDRSGDSNPYGDLQYGYVSYGGNKNNLLLNAGRQFVAEGVATERIDGLYLHSDLAKGFGVSTFMGAPVVTQSNFKGGDVIYGGRVTHSIPRYYTIGLSALRTDYDNSRIREESGVDLWVHPIKEVDIVGRSSYNAITSGWMEHAYTATISPLSNLRINADISKINYQDYFYQVTTDVFSFVKGLINPQEDVLTMGGSVEVTLTETLRLTADYKNCDYHLSGPAHYYGGKASFSLPDSFAVGASIHRMDGENAKLRYNEYRVYASKGLGKASVIVDFFDVNYDSGVNGITNTYSASAAVAYDLTESLRAAVDVGYAKTADFDHALSSLIKLTWSFDKQFGTEGGAKSEKK